MGRRRYRIYRVWFKQSTIYLRAAADLRGATRPGRWAVGGDQRAESAARLRSGTEGRSRVRKWCNGGRRRWRKAAAAAAPARAKRRRRPVRVEGERERRGERLRERERRKVREFCGRYIYSGICRGGR